MPKIWALGQIETAEKFDARVVLQETQNSPENNRWIKVTYSILTPSAKREEYVLSQPIQEIRLTHHIGRPDLATSLREPNFNPWEDELMLIFCPGELALQPKAENFYRRMQEAMQERYVYDPDNFYQPTTAPDKLRLRIVQVLDETRNALGRYPLSLEQIKRMIGQGEEKVMLYSEAKGEEFCEKEKKRLTAKGISLDEKCYDVW